MSITKEIYEGTCFEYPGFVREILLHNNTQVLINICLNMSNEKGWNFSKIYPDRSSALDSLAEYLYLLRMKENTSTLTFSNQDVEESIKKINADIKNKSVFLPDDGAGYEYH